MRIYLIGVVLICCGVQGGTAFADYETSKSLFEKKKYKQAFEACWEEARDGNDECQNFIGYLYIKGRGTAQNDEKAIEWWRRAADQGNSNAQWRLGLFSFKKKDNKEAIKWWRLAAEQDYSKAQHSLGVVYTEGTGVIRDDREAAKWTKLAAEQGDSGSQTNLGNMYSEGRGLSQSDKEAVKWWRLAADQGVAIAQYNLGRSYEDGSGLPKDNKAAIELYRSAADQGYAKAQEKLIALLQKEAINKPAKNLKDISEEKILADIFGKTIKGWEIKKEDKNIIRILNSNNNNNNPIFTIALFSSEKSDGSNIQGFFCKIEIEYKKIADELFFVNIRTIESELGKKHKILNKYYANFYPLCSAVKGNNENLVKNLLRKGADVNEIDNYYWTPLLHAYANKLKNIEKLLISRGADIQHDGAKMLAITLRDNDFTSAKELLNRGVDINSKPKTGSRSARSAIESAVGNEAAFKFLVENGADIGVKNYYGGSLLHEAVDCLSGNLNVAKYLIEKGLDVNAVASNGRTPLINACGCSACKPEYIQLLLDNGADIHIKAGYHLSDGSTRQGDAYNWAKGSGCDQNIQSIIHRLQ